MAKLLWTQRQNIGPTPRFGHAMACDERRQQVVLFGGDSGRSLLGDTWAWDGSSWTQLSDIGPAARQGHTLAYDERRARVVLFGGRLRDRLADDTWEWDGEDWTQIANAGPAGRANPAMAYHPARKRVTLFGGFDPQASFADTWEWDGDEWTQQEDTGPAARHSHVMASDALGGGVVLFGGDSTTTGETFQDTWTWDGAEWTQIAAFGPPPVANAGMVRTKNRIVLFGGMLVAEAGQPRTLTPLTWEWTGKRWTLRQDIGPGARMGHAMAFDRVRSRVVLFGGAALEGPTPLGDTWEHVDATTGILPPDPGPFDFSVQPASATFRDNAAAVFVLAPSLVPIQVQLSYAAPALAGVPTFLPSVTIPANVTNFQVSLPLQQMHATLTNNGFVTPGDVTIAATSDGVGKSAVLRFVAG
jgi:hypothetical protein